MDKLATFVMTDRWRATGAVVGFALLGLIIPPITLLSGAALSLVGLRLGIAQGLSILGLAVLAMAVLSTIIMGQPWIGAVFGLAQWAPLLGLTLILRHTVSLALTLKAGTATGLAAVLGSALLIPNIDSVWKAVLDDIARPALTRADVPAATVNAILQQAAPVMTGSFVAATLLSLALSLLIARWWQALLYNPGGFREEFLALQLGPLIAGLTLALVAGALLTKASLLIELAMVASVMFFLQGMAVTHTAIANAAHPTLWLVGFYSLLLLALPQMMVGIAALGTIDAFADFRARLGGKRRD
ncbi:MAG: DUF2232 domain-containing protein [Pseudomonadota bacterium]|nr:DUF2232 domain-containing protein [Pseudomonadota bacterium]